MVKRLSEHESLKTPTGREFAGRDVHLIGIGGCGMSGLARMLVERGARVAGSDRDATRVTAALCADGVEVGCDADGPLPEACDLVVASAAIRADHPLMIDAANRGIPVLTYAEALGRCMLGRTGVAIAGTHGKSTTAAMLGVCLAEAGLDPSVIVGANCQQFAGANGHATGYRLGAEEIPTGDLAGSPGVLICEACEFNRSFHALHPALAAITSVEADHLDIYGSLDAVVEAFRDFARLLPDASDGGYLLIGHDGAMRREVTGGVTAAIETIGFAPEADWQVVFDPTSRRTELRRRGESVAEWITGLPGEHNAMNAASAAVLAMRLGAAPTRVAAGLEAFRGLERRLQFLGEKRLSWPAGDGLEARGAVRVYDDYGHHPTEIESTLRALRDFERPELRGGRLICVFQPHQHSRTRFLLDEFAQAFTHADVVIVPHIYFVRDSEAERTKVNAADLVDRLRARDVHAMHLYPFDAIVEQLQNLCRPDDLLVVMGAGPVWQVASNFLASGAHDDDRGD